jgi:hypothetical protein
MAASVILALSYSYSMQVRSQIHCLRGHVCMNVPQPTVLQSDLAQQYCSTISHYISEPVEAAVPIEADSSVPYLCLWPL